VLREESRAALSALAEELIAHMATEETVFYRAVEGLVDEARLDRARAAHAEVRRQLRRVLEAGHLTRVRALRELVERHAEEEEKHVFDEVERRMSDADLALLGEELSGSRPVLWMVVREGHFEGGVSLPIPGKTACARSG
jgi:hypothetical protein